MGRFVALPEKLAARFNRATAPIAITENQVFFGWFAVTKTLRPFPTTCPQSLDRQVFSRRFHPWAFGLCFL